ncbi:cytochrome p450 [Colletotrichum sojae]|uniref:Cytochrome p450 n=1 Tax=Colletotrichum sojae TaxID=2175907 RepID=A0A8H6IQB5_9PEZI|nr:cytochrome p450 [Colletotrichum sojae]
MSQTVSPNIQATMNATSQTWADLPALALPGSVTAGYVPYLMALVLLASIMALPFYGKKNAAFNAFPVVNKTQDEYLRDGKGVISRGINAHAEKPFRVNTGLGPGVIVMDPKYTNELRNDQRLDSTKFLLQCGTNDVRKQYWQAGIPGFEPYIALSSEILHNVVKWNLTQAGITKLSQPLAEGTDIALKDILTDSEEWHEISLADVIIRIVARVSSVVFLGPELSQDPEWLRITVNYTKEATEAARHLRRWPSFTYKVIHWFLPACQRVRSMVNEAREIIRPILEQRRKQKAAGGGVKFNDSLEWYENIAEKMGVTYDPAPQQLGLAVSAILTSNDLMSQCVLDLCRNPELVEPLRQEIRSVLGDEGWTSTSLYNMKLLDSVLKETLRMKPVSRVGLGRLVLEDVKLSDGTFLPKGAGIAVNAKRMWDPEIYENPETFDGYRFLRMRESGKAEQAGQLVSTSPDHFGFGIGIHACPGRFFGANTVKLVLSQFLLKYDFKLAEGTPTNPMSFGFAMLSSPMAKVLIRRRKESL